MKKIIGNYGLQSENEFIFGEFRSDQSVYEVIRIIHGVALFLEDHFQRLLQSSQINGISFNLDFNEFKEKIYELVILHRRVNGNVKFVYLSNQHESHWFITFIPGVYPGKKEYKVGVDIGLLYAERENPNAKIIHNMLRNQANKILAEDKLYEVLLVNRNGQITEGSRSNVFFMKNDVFYTAPVSMVLDGITRQKVLKGLYELGYPVVEEAVKVEEINQFDAVFLTGTSPKVLPVRKIENQFFASSHPLVNKLIDCYNEMIAHCIFCGK